MYPRDDRQLAELLEETQVLSRLIEDLRTLALSDAGALTLQKDSTNLVDLVEEVVTSMRPEADRKSVSLSASSSIETVMVDIDPVRIREVLTNLLSNALRHSAAGCSVTVSVSEAPGSVAVTVRDAGEGMSPEEVARIFDRFYKGAKSGGSGLGLAIVRSIVSAHGGDIRASSEPGKGTTLSPSLLPFPSPFTAPRRGGPRCGRRLAATLTAPAASAAALGACRSRATRPDSGRPTRCRAGASPRSAGS